MAAPYSSPRSKIDRAIVAYLISADVGTAASISPAKYSSIRTLPCIIAHSHEGTPEDEMTGDYRFKVKMCVKSAIKDQPTEAAGTQAASSDELFAEMQDALMQSDNDQDLRATAVLITASGRALATSDPTNNGDMADFTCKTWYDKGFDGELAEDGNGGVFWLEIALFEAVACSANVD